MTDIALCRQAACPMSAKCYRFTADPNPLRQAYFAPDFDERGCEKYLPVFGKVTANDNND